MVIPGLGPEVWAIWLTHPTVITSTGMTSAANRRPARKYPALALAGRMLLISHAPPRPLLGSSLLLLDVLRSPSREAGGIRNQWGNFVLLRSRRAHRAVIATRAAAASM